MEQSITGKIKLETPQQKWRGDPIMQVSVFAGQDMGCYMKSDEDSHLFNLHYLGFKSPDFVGMEAAKNKASRFAREVLDHLSTLIAE